MHDENIGLIFTCKHVTTVTMQYDANSSASYAETRFALPFGKQAYYFLPRDAAMLARSWES